jgi:hypothetical protein
MKKVENEKPKLRESSGRFNMTHYREKETNEMEVTEQRRDSSTEDGNHK